MESILVTGANGFIGGYLCRHLMEAGYHVRGTVRRVTGRGSGGVDYLPGGEIDGTTAWKSVLGGVNAVVHTAARRHKPKEDSRDNLEGFRRVNVAGTERLAREAAAVGVRRFVYLSTMGAKVVEQALVGKGDSPFTNYQLSKWEAERALQQVASETGLEIVILRPPFVYGWPPRGNFRMLLTAVARGIPLPFAGIENRRSIVYVGNLVSAIQACLTHSQAAGGLFEISDGPGVSTPEFVRRLAVALGRPPRLWPCPDFLFRLAGLLPGRKKDMKSLWESQVIDEWEIQSRLDWRPPYSMDEALAETVAAMRQDH